MRHPETNPLPRGNPGRKYENIPTRVAGVELIVEKGTSPRIGKKLLETLSILGNLFRKYKGQAKELNETVETTRQEIIEIAEKREGLRGITNEEENLRLTVYPRETVTYNPELLVKSLGLAYSFIAREEMVITITIPPEVAKREEITKSLEKALIDLGIKKRDLEKVMKTEIKLNVADEALMEMIKEGRAKLMTGARETDTSWTVQAVDLKRRQRVAKEETPSLSSTAS